VPQLLSEGKAKIVINFKAIFEIAGVVYITEGISSTPVKFSGEVIIRCKDENEQTINSNIYLDPST